MDAPCAACLYARLLWHISMCETCHICFDFPGTYVYTTGRSVSRPYQDRIKTIKALLQAISTPKTTHIGLESETIHLELGLRDKGPAGGLVLGAWPAGCTVSGGTIQLPRCAPSVLLLAGSGVHFTGTTFAGAAVHDPLLCQNQVRPHVFSTLPPTPGFCAVAVLMPLRVPLLDTCVHHSTASRFML